MFTQNLNTGQQAEVFVAHIFEKRGYKIVKKATDYFPDWDLAVMNRQGEIKKIEVKHDLKAHRTQNFFLERKCLEHSKADILIYCYGLPITHLYFLDLQKTLIRLAPHPADTKGGQQGDFGWLFSKRKFQEILKPQIVNV